MDQLSTTFTPAPKLLSSGKYENTLMTPASCDCSRLAIAFIAGLLLGVTAILAYGHRVVGRE